MQFWFTQYSSISSHPIIRLWFFFFFPSSLLLVCQMTWTHSWQKMPLLWSLKRNRISKLGIKPLLASLPKLFFMQQSRVWRVSEFVSHTFNFPRVADCELTGKWLGMTPRDHMSWVCYEWSVWNYTKIA